MKHIIVLILLFTASLCQASLCYSAENLSLRKTAKSNSPTPNLNKNLKRAALIIGNNNYSKAPLKTPANEAHIISNVLKKNGFIVYELANLSKLQFTNAVSHFGKQLSGKDIGFFYYAGYGVQLKGINYLIPVDTRIKTEHDVAAKCIPLDDIINMMQKSGATTNILAINASHDAPIRRDLKTLSPGLAIVTAPWDTLISFSTSPGMTTSPAPGNLSPYANALALGLEMPGISADELFDQVGAYVENLTGKTHIPWKSSAIKPDISLNPPLESLNPQSKSAPVHFSIYSTSHLRNFTEPTTGIEFITIPGGCFQMGDIYSEGFEWGSPPHIACVDNFAIGKFEVTQGQWQKVMGNNPSKFTSCGDNCPVERVSWEDTQEFIRRLNKLSGESYRLPTEAEWEYAARSAEKFERTRGSGIDAIAWYNSNSDGMPHPVGSKNANNLGLHDMIGNVWEWVQDWFGGYNRGRETNPAGPSSGTYKVFRGGSWSHGPEHANPAVRYYNLPDNRLDFLGFRLAAPPKRQ